MEESITGSIMSLKQVNPVNVANIFQGLPKHLDEEVFEILLKKGNLKVERIISRGHASPATGWYDQAQDEWVMVLQGEAIITLKDDKDYSLGSGDYMTIPAHTKHKVTWTLLELETIWLAIHY
jgi:cupin 2 domain-containing protein